MTCTLGFFLICFVLHARCKYLGERRVRSLYIVGSWHHFMAARRIGVTRFSECFPNVSIVARARTRIDIDAPFELPSAATYTSTAIAISRGLFQRTHIDISPPPSHHIPHTPHLHMVYVSTPCAHALSTRRVCGVSCDLAQSN